MTPRHTNWNKIYTTILKYVVLIILSFIITGPVLTAVLGGMRTNGEFIARPLDLPRHGVQWRQYTSILETDSFWNATKNSIRSPITPPRSMGIISDAEPDLG